MATNPTPAFMTFPRPARAVAPLPENVALRCAGPVARRLPIGVENAGDLPEESPGIFPQNLGVQESIPNAPHAPPTSNVGLVAMPCESGRS